MASLLGDALPKRRHEKQNELKMPTEAICHTLYLSYTREGRGGKRRPRTKVAASTTSVMPAAAAGVSAIVSAPCCKLHRHRFGSKSV